MDAWSILLSYVACGLIGAGVAVWLQRRAAPGEPHAEGDATNAPKDAPATELNAEEPTTDASAGKETADVVAPAPFEKEDVRPRHGATSLNLTGLSRALIASADPIAYLREWRRRVEERLDGPAGDAPSGALERFLSRSLDEAGIDDPLLDQAGVSVVRTGTSGLFYLRANVRELPFGSLQRVVAVEAALNGALLASGLIDQKDRPSLEDVYRALQALDARISAQSAQTPRPSTARMDKRLGTIMTARGGEWAARCAVSRDIECLRLPYRLRARFRLNLAAGEAALVFDHTPPEVLRASCALDGVGVVRRTRDMLERESGAYDLRVALLLARRVLADCPQVERVWVADSHDTPSGHVCHLSAAFDRSVLMALDLTRDFDPFRLCLALGVTMDVRDHKLMPVRQGFSLDDERFCPPARFDAPELSRAPLPPAYAAALGARHVCDLGAFEEADRIRAGEDIMRGMGGSTDKDVTQSGVRAVMEVAERGGERSRRAAERVARKLVEGSLDASAWSVAEEYCRGDLADAVELAADLIEAGRAEEAVEAIEPRLMLLDADGTYQDACGVVWRSFGSYADRVVYNRLVATPDKDTRLVPQDYLEAVVALVAAYLGQGNAELAGRYARRATQLAPTSTRERLCLVRCLEEQGLLDEAKEQVNVLLERAHDAEALGWGYWHMAHILWGQGDVEAAQACLQRAATSLPSLGNLTLAGLGMLVLTAASGQGLRQLSEKEVLSELTRAGVVVAPTPQMMLVILEAAQAATDAELFPVARDLTLDLAGLLHDDVVFGILGSFEEAPDR